MDIYKGVAMTHLTLYSQKYESVETNRDRYIGGSDVGTILGTNPYKSPFTLWCEKTGRIIPEDISDKEAVWWGSMSEDLVAKRFCAKTGMKVRRSNFEYRCREYPFLVGHVDRRIVGTGHVLECKTTSSFNKTDYEGGYVPDAHYAQVQFYLMLTGAQKGYIATKRDSSFYIFEVKRDNDFIEDMLQKCIAFWNLVETDTPPATDGTESTTKAIDRVYLPTKGGMCLFTDDEDTVLHTLAEKEAELKRLKDEVDSLKNEIKLVMMNREYGESTGYAVTWKAYTKDQFDSKRFKEEHPGLYRQYTKVVETRRFSVKERNK